MKTNLWKSITLTALFLASSSAFAQNDSQKQTTATNVKPPLEERGAPIAWERQVKDLNFDDIQLDEGIDELRKYFPEVNMVMSGEPSDYRLNLILRNVGLSDIMEAMNIALNGEVQVRKQSDRLVAFHCRPAPRQSQAVIRAFNISRYLRSVVHVEDESEQRKYQEAKIKELYEVLHESWDMLQQVNPSIVKFPQINLHRETQLLIAIGRPEELDFIEQIVNAVSDSSLSPQKLDTLDRGSKY